MNDAERNAGRLRLFLKRRWIVTTVAAFLLYTLAGFFVVPRLIRSQIRDQARSRLNREARVDEVRFNPFTLAATVTGLRLDDTDGTALVTLDRLHADLEASGLFRWALRFREIRFEHPVVAARILADGRPAIADLITSKANANTPFQPPRLIVDRFTVTRGVVQFSDASTAPPYQHRFEPLNLDVTDLTTIPQARGSHTIVVGVGDGAELKWTGQQTVEPLHLTGRFDIVGLDLHRLWDYLGRSHPIDVAGGRANVTVPYDVERGNDGQFGVSLTGATATIRTLSIHPRGETADWLAVPDARVLNVNAAWPAGRVDVERVQLAKPHVLARIESAGTFNWTRILAGAVPAPVAPPGSASSPTRVTSSGPAHAPAVVPSSPASSSRPLDVRIGSVDVDDASVTFEDERSAPAVKLELTGLTANAKAVTNTSTTPIAMSAKGRVQDTGAIDVSGTIVPSPLAADLRFAAQTIDLASLGAYVTQFVPGARLGAGTAALDGTLSLAGEKQTIAVAANGSLDDVELRDRKNERVIAWHRLAIDRLTYDSAPDRARVRKVTLDRPFAKMLIDRDGALNLSSLVAAPAPSGAVPPTSSLGAPATAAAAGAVTAGAGTTTVTAGAKNGTAATTAVEVTTVEIRDASAEFADDSLVLPFTAQIHSAHGTIRDLSSTSAAPATVAIEGRIDETGYAKADGTLRLSNPLASSELAVSFRGVAMPELTPYFAEFAGYRVREGTLDLDLRYLIKDRRLDGTNKIVARNLSLGDKVDSSKAPPLPIRLAIALLKDKDGRISIDVPIEGTVDDPQWSYRKVFWAAVRTMLGNLAKAPFRAIGRLFGRDEDNLELVEFDPGRSDLLPAEQATLARVAGEIAPRSNLVVSVEGRFDPESDTPALKRRTLDALIESRREASAAAAAASGRSTIETILETLFTEQFTADGLQRERQRFTAAPPMPAPAPTQVPAQKPPSAPTSPSPRPADSTTAPSPVEKPVNAPALPRSQALPSAASSASQGAGAAATSSVTAAFDASGFYESLRARLLEAQTIGPAELAALASARAASIRTALTSTGLVDAARVSASEPTPVKRRKKGSTRVAAEMTMSAEPASAAN